MTTDLIFQLVAPAGYRSVDTFFFLGGILLTRGLLKTNFSIKKKPFSSDGKDVDLNVEKTNTSSYQTKETELYLGLRKQGVITTITTFIPRYFFYIFVRVARYG